MENQKVNLSETLSYDMKNLAKTVGEITLFLLKVRSLRHFH